MIGEKEIAEILRTKKVVYGYKESIKMIKNGKGELIIIAENTPEEKKKEIEYNAKISGIKLEIFPGSSKKLGLLCGRPHPITVLVVE